MENQITIQTADERPGDELAVRLADENKRRSLYEAFIKSNLKEGTDYGVIKIRGVDSKPCLFKPGAEKFISLLGLTAAFRIDKETMDALGDKADGNIIYLCQLHRRSGDFASEGRGSCSTAEKQGNLNTTIKISEKRAMLDAVLRLGLSDTFTQDLEDLPEMEQKTQVNDFSPAEDKKYLTAINTARLFLKSKAIDGEKQWSEAGFKQMLSAVYGTSSWKHLGMENKKDLLVDLDNRVASIKASSAKK